MFIIGTYVKTTFKNSGSPCYFFISRVQKIKSITNSAQKKWFLFTFLVSFFIAFLAQKLIYTINISFIFAFGSFFEHDYLLNLIIVGVYAKRWPKFAHIWKKKLDLAENLIFFLTLTVRGSPDRKDFKRKTIGGMGLIFERTEALYTELNERAEAASSRYSATCDFLQFIYFVLVAKNPIKVFSSWIFFRRYFQQY